MWEGEEEIHQTVTTRSEKLSEYEMGMKDNLIESESYG